jgi:hypothetical protein
MRCTSRLLRLRQHWSGSWDGKPQRVGSLSRSKCSYAAFLCRFTEPVVAFVPLADELESRTLAGATKAQLNVRVYLASWVRE